MTDETNPPFPEETKPAAVIPTNQTTTSTQTETIETALPGKRRPGELFGMSGRFWVTIFSIIGATYVMVLVLQSDMQSETKAMMAGAYIALASSIGNTYMGQNAGPTKPKPS